MSERIAVMLNTSVIKWSIIEHAPCLNICERPSGRIIESSSSLPFEFAWTSRKKGDGGRGSSGQKDGDPPHGRGSGCQEGG